MSLLHNTTFVLDRETESEFLEYMRVYYLPVLSQSSLVADYGLHLIRTSEEETQALSYALHLRVLGDKELEQHWVLFGARLAEQLSAHFGSRVLGFSTVMEEIDLAQKL